LSPFIVTLNVSIPSFVFLCEKHYKGQNEAKPIFSIYKKKILEEIYKGDVIKHAITTLTLCF